MNYILMAALLLFSAFSFGQNASFENLEKMATNHIAKSQWDDLLVIAPELITADPTKPNGYFYTAYAFVKLKDYVKASEYLSMAETYKNTQYQQKIKDLKNEITNQEKNGKIAASILSKKYGTNSAEDFKKLWELDKSKTEFALSAVELYLEKENYLPAIELLEALPNSGDPQVKQLIEKINQKPKVVLHNRYKKIMKEGDEYYMQGSYSASFKKYEEALKIYPKDANAATSKYKAKEEIDWQTATNLNSFDSFLKYLAQYPSGKYKNRADDILQRSYLKTAREFAKDNKYSDAVSYYKTYQSSYPFGPQISIVNQELCQLYFNEAKRNEKIKSSYNIHYALEQYELAKNCGINSVSKSHLNSLKRKEKRWGREEMFFMGWHADEKNLLGLTSGSLKNRRLGMYVAIRASFDIFQSSDAYWETTNNNSLAESVDKNKTFNGTSYDRVVISTFGITKKVIYPFWIYAGAGICVNSQVKEFEHNNTGKIEYVNNKDRDFMAINPELGVQVHLGVLTLRYGLNKPLDPLFQEEYMQHFGVGFKL